MTKLLDLVSDLATGVNKGLTTDLVGAPVDIINMGLKAVGVPTSKYPVGGSDWIKMKLNLKPSEQASISETMGSVISSFANPASSLTATAGTAKLIAAAKSMGIVAAPGIIGSAKRLLDPAAYESAKTQAHYLKGVDGTAESMYKNSSLYERTGAYLGTDNRLKSVISDAKAKINPVFTPNPYAGKNNPDPLMNIDVPYGKGIYLKDILDHPELYKHYPELKYVIVSNASGLRDSWFSEGTKQIGMGSYKRSEIDNGDFLRTLLHEVQHGVQGVEGFAKGGGSVMFQPANHAERSKHVADNLKALESDLGNRYDKFNMFASTPDLIKRNPGIMEDPAFTAYVRFRGEVKDIDNINRNTFNKYQRLGGEAESRSVEAMHKSGDFEGFPLGHTDIPLGEIGSSPLDPFINALGIK